MKREPNRQCMGCRERFPKADLLRVVRPPGGGDAALDTTGKAQGRGAYLCKNAACLKRVRKSRALERLLKTRVPDDVYAALESITARQP